LASAWAAAVLPRGAASIRTIPAMRTDTHITNIIAFGLNLFIMVLSFTCSDN